MQVDSADCLTELLDALLCGAAAGFKKSSWSGITYYTRNMPESNSHGSGSRRTSMQQQQLLERFSSPPPHARQQWYEQAAAEAAMQEQEEPSTADSSSSSSGAGGHVPFVLLHGIGMGLIPYISLLFNMAATGKRACACLQSAAGRYMWGRGVCCGWVSSALAILLLQSCCVPWHVRGAHCLAGQLFRAAHSAACARISPGHLLLARSDIAYTLPAVATTEPVPLAYSPQAS
jgi:hypothetical protein